MLTDSEGTPLGSSDSLPIRSNRVSNVIWLILGTGLALLFGTIVVRLFRRIRAGGHVGVSAPMTTFDDERPEEERERVLANSAVMAAGTVVSRMSGFIRSALLAAALGASLHADLFNIANTIPNMLYILLAGGVVNAVLVPQLVRTMRHDADGGEAYANRIITLAALFLGIVTVLLVVAAPWVMSVFLTSGYAGPEHGRAARLGHRLRPLLPAAGLLLRDVRAHRTGAQRARPLRADDVGADRQQRHLDRGAGRLPGRLRPRPGDRGVRRLHPAARSCCSASARPLGIAAQFLILVPYLRSTGFHYRPRFDFVRHRARATPSGSALWTVLFVIVNQIAYTVVVRLASSGTRRPATGGSTDGTGYTIYSKTFLIMMVPHSIITVSLATAILPRLAARAADDDLAAVARSLS